VLKAAKAKKSEHTFPAKTPKKVYPPKYVNPSDGRTWSGLGHTPSWIVGNRDDYLIKNSKETQHRVTQNNQPKS
jgi:DNA-binding protein H-NS